jgi:hypothetical protein
MALGSADESFMSDPPEQKMVIEPEQDRERQGNMELANEALTASGVSK